LVWVGLICFCLIYFILFDVLLYCISDFYLFCLLFFVSQYNTVDVLDAFNSEVVKLGAMGVTVTVSSGDNGAAGGSGYCYTDSSSSSSNWPVRTLTHTVLLTK
jgi:subtilase family serine protease